MSQRDGGDVAEDDLAWIDRRADEFEQAWREGRRPRIEVHLGGAGGPTRTALLEELMMIEWQRRLGPASSRNPRRTRPDSRSTPAGSGRRPWDEPSAWNRRSTLNPTATPTSEPLPVLGDYEVLPRSDGAAWGSSTWPGNDPGSTAASSR